MPEMLIGGEWQPAAGGASITGSDPATEAPVDAVPGGAPEDVDRAVEAAAAAFGAWSRTDPESRADLVRKAVEAIDTSRDRIVDTLVHEQGKP
ncbi:MAG: aldehyde dehydrogenase family protein, partial [Gaiellales bacterium]